MLITYADSMGHNLKDLKEILDRYFKSVVGGVHILPFFPSSGDRGFAPMDYTKVDSAFGNWDDIEALSRDYYLMFDYMINHISAQSEYYKDFLEKKDASRYRDLFILATVLHPAHPAICRTSRGSSPPPPASHRETPQD